MIFVFQPPCLSTIFCTLLIGGCRAAVEQIGEVYRLRAYNAEDPLLDVVDILESNCRNARDVLQSTRHMLTCLFFEFFPKKKNDAPTTNLKRLFGAFDTIEALTLQLKRLLGKRGAKGTVALSLSHGEQVDWSKLSSSQACNPSKMKKFFAEMKEYSQNLVELILSVMILFSVAPSSSASPAPDSHPPRCRRLLACLFR
jgi:hypothetical protein